MAGWSLLSCEWDLKGLTHSFLAVEVRNSLCEDSEEELCLLILRVEMEDSK